jgi:lipid A 3-O-deacylase PagL
MCFAPLILLGALVAVQTPWHQTTPVSSPVVEVQTCETGFGVDAKASSAGFYGLGGQYGWQWKQDNYSLGLLPKAGISFVDHTEPALPLGTQFEVGLQGLAGYDHWRLGLEYWHLSNAGLKYPNIGMDFLVMQVGWAY